MNINNPTTFGVPNLTLSTSNSSGTGGALRADDTVLVYDTTLPDAITFGQSGNTGDTATAARRNHSHAMAGNLSGLAKVWANLATDAQVMASYNVDGASLSSNIYTVTFDTAFSSAFYAVVVTCEQASGSPRKCQLTSKTAGTYLYKSHTEGTSGVDAAAGSVAFGTSV